MCVCVCVYVCVCVCVCVCIGAVSFSPNQTYYILLFLWYSVSKIKLLIFFNQRCVFYKDICQKIFLHSCFFQT